MASSSTTPKVFIIESLDFDDEENQRYEGRILSQILQLSSEIESVYFYIRTRRELERIVTKFAKSRFRYLHLSCHGNPSSMATTLDEVPLHELGAILAPGLHKRRLFLSACQMASPALAQGLLPSSGCYSVIGPASDVDFGDAALLWASFYHLMFRDDRVVMKREQILKHLKSTAGLFEVPLNYFAPSRTRKEGYQLTRIGTGTVAQS